MATHEVINVPPDLPEYDALAAEPALIATLDAAGLNPGALGPLPRLAGSAQARRWADDAHAHPPVLHTHTVFGARRDEVEYHPSYHRLMSTAVEQGLHGAPWAEQADGDRSAHLRRAAGFYLWSQVEAGHGCPVSMTYAVVPALREEPALAAVWEPLVTARAYDPRPVRAADKPGAIAGMGMTEKQGGSDVRANSTVAVASPDDGAGAYRLTGHKFFCSAPMSDLFLVTARAPGGITCFLLPRVLPDGTRNSVAIQRLKDKLGNHSNASSEIELDAALAWRVGPEGRGIRTILGMVSATRLDCVVGSAATQRAALTRAVWHTRHRDAFGARLADQPLMRAVLADLAVESAAATALAMRLATAVDHGEHALLRVLLPAAKYTVCKRTPAAVAESLECLGGTGFVEASGMPRLFRESPLNSIWEGSGSVTALDLLRALDREPEATDALLAELGSAFGADRRLDAAVRDVVAELGDRADGAGGARRLAEKVATAVQGALLVRAGDPDVADLFCATRLGGDWGATLGTLPAGTSAQVTGRIVADGVHLPG